MPNSNNLGTGRIGLLLYNNRLVLKQVTVQGFELLHLFIRLSFFMAITVAGAASVLSSNLPGEHSD